MNKKAAIYDPYLDTLGGGERYCLTVAEILLKNGYSVDLFWSGDPQIVTKAESRFNLKLSQIKIVPDIFHIATNEVSLIEDTQALRNSVSQPIHSKNVIQKTHNFLKNARITKKYDLIFYLSDGSLPFVFGKNNLLHAQVPLNLDLSLKTEIFNQVKLINFKHIVCNSRFTSAVIKNLYRKKCQILYPPVDVNQFVPGSKAHYIISVGRFDNILNAKKQDTLINAFKKLVQNKDVKDWKLILAGGSTTSPEKNSYLSHLKVLAKGLPVEFYVNPDFSQLKQLYSKSSIYWHAAGFEVDQIAHPENTEHFGITVVEAMASGAVPVVVNKGGLPEIIDPDKNGYLWATLDDLVAKTQLLISHPQKITSLSQQAIKDSLVYSKQNFEDKLLSLL